jgi:hypothetical protein
VSEGHARLGPSNHRWPNCPGSVREEAAYEDIPGEAAIDGTGSHLLLELCLQNGVRADTYDGQVIGCNHPDNPMGWLVSEDRIERVQMCLDYVSRRVRELRDAYPGSTVKVETESKADVGGMFGRGDWWGTVDITISAVNNHGKCLFLEVCDYKDGRGWVHVPGNTQLISYLAGKLRPFVASGPDLCRPFRPEQVGPCRMTIVQPKTDPVVRYEDTTATYIIAEAEKLAHAARATDDPEAPLIPDSKGGKGYCRWCKHKSNCTAESGRSLETVKTMTTDVIATDGTSLFELVGQSLDKVKELTVDQLSELADARAGIEAIFEKVEAEINTRLESGETVPGYALQPGRGSNVWNDSEENIAKMLKARRLKKDQIFPPKLISPAQVLKLDCLDDAQKKRIEKDYITHKAGKLRLTKVSREKQKVSAEDMFKDVPSPSLFEEPAGNGTTDDTASIQKIIDEDVAQSTTKDVQSEPEQPISFF